MNIKNNLNLFLITLVAYFSGLTNILLLELISNFILFFIIIKSSIKFWLSREGIFIILFSLITIPFIISEPSLLYNHFKKLILTLSILIFSFNLKPISSSILSIISIINFFIVFLQVNFNIILFPSIFFQDSYLKNYYENDRAFRAVGILVGSHPSTFLISLASLALFYANKESLNLLIKGKLTKKNLFLIFIFFINFLSIFLSYTNTPLIALFFQFFIIFANRKFFLKFFKNFYKKIYFKFSGLKINLYFLIFPITISLILMNFDFFEDIILSFSEVFIDGRGIASLGIIVGQFRSILDIITGLSIFPTSEIIVDTTLGEATQTSFYLPEIYSMGLEIGYFKVMYTHGVVIGIYILSLLFRKLYGVRIFLFLAFLHYAHITTNPLILIMAITASQYAKINSKEMLSRVEKF
tara:strand:- start:62 stop:1297 length:1236 start_codon:yes stop_codon:yes gene_type:complete